MKKVFIILGIILLSITMSSCKKEIKLFGGSMYVPFRENTNDEIIPSNWYVGYEFNKREYDIDNVEMTVYYGISEENFRNEYRNILSGVYGDNQIVEYNFHLYLCDTSVIGWEEARESNETKVLNDGVYILEKIEFNDLEIFPFEEYEFRYKKVENGKYLAEGVFKKSIKVIIPKEIFIEDEGRIVLDMADIFTFSNGKVHTIITSYYYLPNYFNYKKEGDKIIIWN